MVGVTDMLLRYRADEAAGVNDNQEVGSLISRLNLEHLAYFVDVVEQGSFANAARKHGKVPSAISNAIANLEIDLGIELFDRSGYRVGLLPAGKQIFKKSLQVLGQVTRLERLAEELHAHGGEQIRVVIEQCVPYLDFYQIIGKLQKEFPHTLFQFHILNLRACTKVLSENIDCIYFGRIPETCHETMTVKHMRSFEFVAAAPAGHVLFDLEREIEFSDLKKHLQVSVDPNVSGVKSLSSGEDVIVEDPLLAREMILKSGAWGVLPDHMIEHTALRSFELPNYSLPRQDMYLASAYDKKFSPYLEFVSATMMGQPLEKKA